MKRCIALFNEGWPIGEAYQNVPHALCDRGVVSASGNAPMTFAAEVMRLADKENGKAMASEYIKYARMEHGIK